MDKPWGYEEEIQATERYSIWKLHINAGQETSFHCHSIKDVFLVVEKGPLWVKRDGGTSYLLAGETLLIERGNFHRLKAPTGAVVLEVEWPNNREDITRKEDKYGRAGC